MTDTQKISELRQLIIEGNRKTNELRMPSASADMYERYWKELIDKVEEITGVEIDFCYYTF